LVNAGKIKPHQVKVMPEGLKSVKAGWDLYRDKKVSGEKLIYRIGKFVPCLLDSQVN